MCLCSFVHEYGRVVRRCPIECVKRLALVFCVCCDSNTSHNVVLPGMAREVSMCRRVAVVVVLVLLLEEVVNESETTNVTIKATRPRAQRL